jgi:hypothetical protein
MRLRPHAGNEGQQDIAEHHEEEHEEGERDEPEDHLPLQSRAADMGCHRAFSRVLDRRRVTAIADGDRMRDGDRSRLDGPVRRHRG